ncbi:aspartate aminotransferase [Planoprotostelium fungivorum]|uniref:Aspartate aminotransferase n=1 Tax=Planoprotostelium fungivorum TaxID=1890364 RepID=A0A2P6N5U6_9EUKA|nr:aspartate aminotransferase [Planoprotostelium fungivorum]
MSELVLSPAAIHLPGSPTIAALNAVRNLTQQGKKIINLGIGEMVPEIPTPDLIKTGMIEAIHADQYGYNPAEGCPELVSALRDDLEENFGLHYELDQIAVCSGPKEAISKAMSVLLHHSLERNEVITWAPIFESYTNVPSYFTGKPTIILDTDEHLNPDLDQLERFLEENNKRIAIATVNTPNNPTGQVYSEEVVRRMASIFSRYPEIAIISDEVYRFMLHDDSVHHSIAKFIPNQTIIVSGISKEISGTGLRLGWLAAPKHVTQAVVNLGGNFTSCNQLPIQLAYANFLRADRDMTMRFSVRDKVGLRRSALLQAMHSLPGFSKLDFEDPLGAFYMFPSVKRLMGHVMPDGRVIDSDVKVSTYLLEAAGVAVLPGSAFHKAGYIRMAYACHSVERLVQAATLMSKALCQLKEAE